MAIVSGVPNFRIFTVSILGHSGEGTSLHSGMNTVSGRRLNLD